MAVSIHEHIRFSLYQVNDFSYTTHRLDHPAQPFYTFSFVARGSVRTSAEGQSNTAGSGDVLIHKANIPFSVHADQPGTHMYINLDLSVMDYVDYFQISRFPKVVTLRNPSHYELTFLALKAAWNRPEDKLREMRSTMLALQLLFEIMESVPAQHFDQTGAGQDLPAAGRFAQVIPYIENNLKQRITREQLARIAHLNPAYFSRQFQKIYGITPMHMVHQLRMRRALQMLENPAHTVEFIAHECGFYDAPYFIRVFRQAYKTTPGAFRAKLELAKKGYGAGRQG